jgi:hypothetical protein
MAAPEIALKERMNLNHPVILCRPNDSLHKTHAQTWPIRARTGHDVSGRLAAGFHRTGTGAHIDVYTDQDTIDHWDPIREHVNTNLALGGLQTN